MKKEKMPYRREIIWALSLMGVYALWVLGFVAIQNAEIFPDPLHGIILFPFCFVPMFTALTIWTRVQKKMKKDLDEWTESNFKRSPTRTKYKEQIQGK